MTPSCSEKSRVRFLEEAHVLLQIIAPFVQRLGVPFAAADGKKVAAIDMNGAGQPRYRVGHRMDDVAAERLGIALAKRFCPGRLDPATVGTRYPTPEDVVLAPGINADHRPDQMVVRHDR